MVVPSEVVVAERAKSNGLNTGDRHTSTSHTKNSQVEKAITTNMDLAVTAA